MIACILLLLAALAGSPALADDLPLIGVGVGHAVSAPFYFPGSPAAIYSTRKVVSAYAGKALNVRRASDSTTQDIGFVGAAFDTAGANSFCASTFCYVTKWYDQSGNGNDVSQATASQQPMLLVVNGNAWVTFFSQLLASASPVALTGDQTIGAVMMTGDGANTLFPLSDYDGSAGWAFIDNYTGAKQAAYWSKWRGFLRRIRVEHGRSRPVPSGRDPHRRIGERLSQRGERQNGDRAEQTAPPAPRSTRASYNNPNSVGQVIFSNVPASGPPYPGYELWIDTSGHLRVRLINNQPSNYLDVTGATNVVDGKKHFVAASYDGSSTAAGVKMYVDGVPETTTILADVLY